MDYDLLREQEQRDLERLVETEKRIQEIRRTANSKDELAGAMFVIFLFVVGTLIIWACIGGM